MATRTAILLLALAAASPYSFDRPEVLDLTEPERLVRFKVRGLVAGALAPDAAAAILHLPDVGMEAPTHLAPSSKEGADAREAESKLIVAEEPAVIRSDKKLEIRPQSGDMVTFGDWAEPARKDADGDSETFHYLGRVGAAKYHRLEVRFGHDAPGSFLVNPASGKTVFVHNGGDVVALSPSGTRLASLHTAGAPYLLAVAAIGAAGPDVEFLCQAIDKHRIKSIAFKGWRDDTNLDLVLTPLEGSPIAIRARLDVRGPRVSVSGPMAAAGYRCWRP
jgi:hypothetical protein